MWKKGKRSASPTGFEPVLPRELPKLAFLRIAGQRVNHSAKVTLLKKQSVCLFHIGCDGEFPQSSAMCWPSAVVYPWPSTSRPSVQFLEHLYAVKMHTNITTISLRAQRAVQPPRVRCAPIASATHKPIWKSQNEFSFTLHPMQEDGTQPLGCNLNTNKGVRAGWNKLVNCHMRENPQSLVIINIHPPVNSTLACCALQLLA